MRTNDAKYGSPFRVLSSISMTQILIQRFNKIFTPKTKIHQIQIEQTWKTTYQVSTSYKRNFLPRMTADRLHRTGAYSFRSLWRRVPFTNNSKSHFVDWLFQTTTIVNPWPLEMTWETIKNLSFLAHAFRY